MNYTHDRNKYPEQQWKKSKIKYCADFMPNCNTDNIASEESVTFTPMECIKQGYFENRCATFSSFNGSYTKYQEGDIVIAKVTPCFENGNIAIMRHLYSGIGFGSSELFVLRPRNINTSFLFYFLQSHSFIERCKSMMTGTGGLKRVPSSVVTNNIIFLPEPVEQSAIADYLDEKCGAIDEIIEQAKATIEEYKAWKSSVIFEAVTKGLDPNVEMKDSGVEWIGKMPETWELKPFRYFLHERMEKNSPVKSTERLSLSIELGVTLYSEKTTNLDRFKDDFEQYKLAHEGDLVMNSMNMIVGASGVSKYFGCISPAYYTFYDKLPDHASAKYCEYVFRSKAMLRILYSLGRGIYAIERGDDRVNTCRLKVPKEDLKALLLPSPSVKEQREIINYLDRKCSAIDEIIAEKEALIADMDAYKKSLIFETVTGKRKVC